MSRWFRHYADAYRNPKVARLSDRDYRMWTIMLSVASENDGVIPPLEDLKGILRMRLDHLSTALERLVRGGLIDPLGTGYEPHNWAKFQYKSDTSTPRVTLHRERKATVVETPPDTETEADTDIPPKGGLFGEAAEPVQADDDKLTIDEVVGAWNANIAGRYDLPKCTKLSDSRKAQIKARLREYSFEEMDGVFRAFGRSKFLQGEPSRDGRRMRADIGWVMNPTNFIKIMEGKYDD